MFEIDLDEVVNNLIQILLGLGLVYGFYIIYVEVDKTQEREKGILMTECIKQGWSEDASRVLIKKLNKNRWEF